MCLAMALAPVTYGAAALGARDGRWETFVAPRAGCTPQAVVLPGVYPEAEGSYAAYGVCSPVYTAVSVAMAPAPVISRQLGLALGDGHWETFMAAGLPET
jgi:hypothetical protein